jgi:hopene-associated glycosyltransferase HpnB
VILGALAVTIWIFLLAGRGGFWRMREPSRPPACAATPDVVAVIPARNEADVIGAALASLGKQMYGGNFSIVLVDDHSTDGTAAAARGAGAENLLRVVKAKALPRGWKGKMWAVSQGVDVAQAFQPEYLLLTDADIVHGSTNVADLVARAEAGRYDLVSYMATLHCETPAERALVPAFVFFFFMLYPPAWGTGAAGGCMLLRASMLERIGGFQQLRRELIDDCALAAAVRGKGGRVWLGLSAGTRSLRAYRSFGEIGSMISRTAFTQLRHSVGLLAGTVLGLAVTYLAPPILALGGSWWGVAAWALMSVAYFPALRYYRRSPLWAPLLPLVALFYLGATMHSAVSYWRGKGGQWKGRIQDV